MVVVEWSLEFLTEEDDRWFPNLAATHPLRKHKNGYMGNVPIFLVSGIAF